MHIKIKDIFFDKEKILNFESSSFLSEYEIRTLFFCKEWLEGKDFFVINTSGSTGKPKEIKITRNQMIFSANNTCNTLKLEENDSSLICISTDHIGGKMMLVRGLIKKFFMTLIEPSSNPLEKIDNNEKFDFFSFVPLQLYEIINKTPEKIFLLNQSKAIIIGGGEVSIDLEKKLKNITAPIYSTYGMTETVSHIALRRLNRDNFFTLLDGIETDIDERECLVIKSEVTNNETIITNDVVEFIDKKTFKWLGRYDNIINSGGIKIQIEELEKRIKNLLLSNNFNNNFFITSIKDEKFGNKIVIIIEKDKLTEENKEEINLLMKDNLSKYEKPKDFFYVNEIFFTKTGKIMKDLVFYNINHYI
ncbi:MAG: AMP-binding protein [Cyanobacteriota bacterium]